MEPADTSGSVATQKNQTLSDLARVAALVHDDEDSESEESAPRLKPGAITPLGVRIDKGEGLLSINSASTTLAEMDSAIANIRQWQQRHDRDIAEVMRRQACALEACVLESQGGEPDMSHEDSEQTEEGDEEQPLSSSGTSKVLIVNDNEISTCLADDLRSKPPRRPASAKPYASTRLHGNDLPVGTPGGITPRATLAQSLGEGALALLKDTAGLRFACLPGDATAQLPGMRSRPMSADPRLRMPSRPPSADSLSSGRPIADEGKGGTAHSPDAPRAASISGGGTPLLAPLGPSRLLPPLHGAGSSSGPCQAPCGHRSLSRLSSGSEGEVQDVFRQKPVLPGTGSSSSSGGGTRSGALVETIGCRPASSPSVPQAITGASSMMTKPRIDAESHLRTPKLAAAGAAVGAGAAHDSCGTVVFRGQQLMDELEAELRLLDEEEGAGLSDWCSDYEGVLAKMDCLQTGYQVQPSHGVLSRLQTEAGSQGDIASGGIKRSTSLEMKAGQGLPGLGK